jgi:AICAR transformylase/IMP cyclohydrolase PurH
MNRALISVYNKKGLEDLVKALEEYRTEIVIQAIPRVLEVF